MRFIAPDDGNEDDRTVMAVTLPEPVGPGETITLDIAFTAKIPRPFARTGAIGNYFFIAQWFPKIGVLDAAGRWNCHQFHVGTEFFADFGVYDVRMTVPRGWPLAATGRERERTDNADGTTTHRYYQEDVHDFAWTTSPDFLEARERFEHPGLPPVEMRLMLQPEHASQAARHFESARATLRHYGEWFGAYPYGHITIVDPAWQSETDGMEYPTLFTVGTWWLMPREDTYLEDTVVHETGHQWWYGMVATNEFEDAWMDEGINQYANARVMAEAFPDGREVRRFFGGFVPWVLEDVRWDRLISGEAMSAYRSNPTVDVQATPSFRYWPRTSTPMTYAKPALWLHTLERALGWTTVQQILSTFFDRWKFKHPRPGDLFQVANEVSGRDLTPFFDQVYRGSAVFDYGVDSVTSTETRTTRRSRTRSSCGAMATGFFRSRFSQRSRTASSGASPGTAPAGGIASRSSTRAAWCRRRSIPIRFWCSTRTSPTTASPPSRRAGAPRRSGRRHGSCGCRISCSPGPSSDP